MSFASNKFPKCVKNVREFSTIKFRLERSFHQIITYLNKLELMLTLGFLASTANIDKFVIRFAGTE